MQEPEECEWEVHSEIMDEIYRTEIYSGTPTLGEILIIQKFLREKVRELMELTRIKDLKAHRVQLYHTRARIDYWERIKKEQKPKIDPLLSWAEEQVRLDEIQSAQETEDSIEY